MWRQMALYKSLSDEGAAEAIFIFIRRSLKLVWVEVGHPVGCLLVCAVLTIGAVSVFHIIFLS